MVSNVPGRKIFDHYFSTPKRIAVLSLLIGLFCALIAGSLTASWLYHKRQASYDVLTQDIRGYMEAFFGELGATAQAIQPLTMTDCGNIVSQLTSHAAFNVNVRAFLLVKEGAAYCSSATGYMNMPLKQMAAGIDINKAVDLAIMEGTPMLPNKPAIAVWYRNPLVPDRGIFTTLNVNLTPYLLYTERQKDVNGIALVVGDKALTTLSPRVIPVDQLGPHPTRVTDLDGYPMSLWLYGDILTTEDIQLSLLAGLVVGLSGGLLCSLILMMRLRNGREIQTAIRRNQFHIVWQPVIKAPEMKFTGVEVLMRWAHPSAGAISPDAFIAWAEARQLIVPLTRHLFTLIARDAPRLSQVLPAGSKLGINLAPSHLHAPEFKQDILDLVDALPPNHFQLVFEITERDMLNENEASDVFNWLHQQGFEIAVDDFGTGHSALIYLERFKLDYLKIDRGFVSSIGMETVTTPVLDAVIALAKRLDMTTVAEGVETQEQARWLVDQGVNYLQGYLFSRPLPIGELIEWQARQD
ncbi:cyclic di-GMP phosphodiesterase [Jejubacter sp. L23]|uniref:cyclic di-GMP phosphodiesterase n=1 Tax=Jejubacter sp. L23 TaxID=3092086 RepID=UPI003D7253D4